MLWEILLSISGQFFIFPFYLCLSFLGSLLPSQGFFSECFVRMSHTVLLWFTKSEVLRLAEFRASCSANGSIIMMHWLIISNIPRTTTPFSLFKSQFNALLNPPFISSCTCAKGISWKCNLHCIIPRSEITLKWANNSKL